MGIVSRAAMGIRARVLGTRDIYPAWNERVFRAFDRPGQHRCGGMPAIEETDKLQKMNLPAFRFVDGKLVELHGFDEWPASIREAIPKQVKPKLRSVTLTPRERRAFARKGRPRRQAKRIAKRSTKLQWPMISHAEHVVRYRHAIGVPRPPRFPWEASSLQVVCFVYLPEGTEVDDAVLDAVARWQYETSC